jgi:hypothetical protein
MADLKPAPACFWRHELRILLYANAPYARVQKSVNTFGGSGESSMRCVKS